MALPTAGGGLLSSFKLMILRDMYSTLHSRAEAVVRSFDSKGTSEKYN